MRQVDAQVKHKWLVVVTRSFTLQERLGLVDMDPIFFMYLSCLLITHRLGNWTWLLAQGEVHGACPRFNTLGLGVPARQIIYLAVERSPIVVLDEIGCPIAKMGW